MSETPAPIITLQTLCHAFVSLIGYPPVMEGLLTRRLEG